MGKLIKYNILNTYKINAIFILLIIASYAIDIYNKITGRQLIYINSLIVIFVFASVIVLSIEDFNESIKGNIIFHTPNSASSIIISRILSNLIWIFLILLLTILLNLLTGYIPFAGGLALHDPVSFEVFSNITINEKIILTFFYIFWTVTFCISLIILGNIIVLISKIYFEGYKLRFIYTGILFLFAFLSYCIFMSQFTSLLPLNVYMNSSGNIILGSRFLNLKEYILQGFFYDDKGNGIFIIGKAGDMLLGMSSIIFNTAAAIVMFMESVFLMKKKLDI